MEYRKIQKTWNTDRYRKHGIPIDTENMEYR